MRYLFFSLVFCCALSFSGKAADEADSAASIDEKIVVTASTMPEDLKEVAGTVEVISAEEIQLKGAITLAEALEDAASLNLTLVAGRGIVPTIRGLGNRRTLVLFNGKRVATDFRNTSVDLTLYSTENIERIEIVRGPFSALYGSEAVGGVINIITKGSPDAFQGGVDLKYSQNNHNELATPSIRGYLGGHLDKLGYRLTFHALNQDMYDMDLDDNFTDFDDEERRFGQLDLEYKIDENQSVSGSIMFSRSNRVGLRYKNKERTDRDADSDRDNITFQYDRSLTNGHLTFSAYQSKYLMDRQYIGKKKQEYFDLENKLTQYELRLSHLELGQHVLNTGLEYRDENRSGIENRGETDIDRSNTNSAIYLQDKWSTCDHFALTMGVRYDDHSSFGSSFTPRLAGVFTFNDHLRLKAYYGEGFRAPTVYELFVETVNNRENVLPNPDLEPEESNSFEISLEGERGRFSGSLRVFKTDLDQAIEKVRIGTVDLGGPRPTPQFIWRNVAKATSEGVEAEVYFAFNEYFTMKLSAMTNDTENESTGESLFNAPEEEAHFSLNYLSEDKSWSGALRFNHTGDQLASIKGHVGKEADAFNMVDFYLSKRFNDKLSLYGGVDNIADEKLNHIPEEGRVTYLGLKVNF